MRLLIAIVLSCSGLGAQNCPILNTVPNKENIVGLKKIGVECVGFEIVFTALCASAGGSAVGWLH